LRVLSSEFTHLKNVFRLQTCSSVTTMTLPQRDDFQKHEVGLEDYILRQFNHVQLHSEMNKIQVISLNAGQIIRQLYTDIHVKNNRPKIINNRRIFQITLFHFLGTKKLRNFFALDNIHLEITICVTLSCQFT
jgi:hypothetical protein